MNWWIGVGLVLLTGLAAAEELKPFTTDGCSAFPDGTLSQQKLWLECCTAHDLAYWKGGSYAERKRADEELKQCVTKVGEPEIAQLMLAGVRVGGTPFLPTSFRWGYGWSYPRFYGELTQEELEQVARVLAETSPELLPVDPETGNQSAR